MRCDGLRRGRTLNSPRCVPDSTDLRQSVAALMSAPGKQNHACLYCRVARSPTMARLASAKFGPRPLSHTSKRGSST
jgi:hypothetical protein